MIIFHWFFVVMAISFFLAAAYELYKFRKTRERMEEIEKELDEIEKSF